MIQIQSTDKLYNEDASFLGQWLQQFWSDLAQNARVLDV